MVYDGKGSPPHLQHFHIPFGTFSGLAAAFCSRLFSALFGTSAVQSFLLFTAEGAEGRRGFISEGTFDASEESAGTADYTDYTDS